MFRFESPKILYLLLVVLGLILFYIYAQYRRVKALRRFGDEQMLKSLMPQVAMWRGHFKFALLLVALVCAIIALARPQFGSKIETTSVNGIEAMFVVDVSNSMLCEDVAPNRMENAKLVLSKLVDNMPDDKVGIILFAGDAFIQLPITGDGVSAKMFLSSISAGSIPVQGTAIGKAISLADKAFGDENGDVGRTIILLTDGENHEDDAVAAAKAAAQRGIVVNVVGFGSPQGSPIPVNGSSTSFKKDRDGNVIVTKLNEQMCQSVAQAGGGAYVRADNSNTALRTLTDALTRIKRGDLEVQSYSAYDEKFYIFAWIALFFLFVEGFVLARKNSYLSKIKLF